MPGCQEKGVWPLLPTLQTCGVAITEIVFHSMSDMAGKEEFVLMPPYVMSAGETHPFSLAG